MSFVLGGSLTITTRLAESTPKDASAFCGIMNGLYNRKVTEEYFFWQFFDSPHTSGLFFLEVDGVVSGVLGTHIIPLKSREKVAWYIDIAIAESHQGKGLFRYLHDAVADFATGHGANALVVMGNPNAHGTLTQKFGWKPVRAIDTWETQYLGTSNDEFQIISNFRDDHSWYTQPSSFFADHSAEWLNRRFFRNPRYQYQGLNLESSDGTQTRVVFKEFVDPASGQKIIDLVEFLSTSNDETAIESDLRKVLDTISGNQTMTFSTWLETGTSFDSVAKKLGFKPLNKPRYFDLKPIDSAGEALLDSARWHLTMQDAEVY